MVQVLVAVGDGALRYRCRLYLVAVPGHPEQRAAAEQVMLDHGKIAQPRFFHRSLDQRLHIRPDQFDMGRIAADQLAGYATVVIAVHVVVPFVLM